MSCHELSFNWGGWAPNSQGGTINANGSNGAITITISGTEFKSNTAGDRVSENLSTFVTFARPLRSQFELFQGGSIRIEYGTLTIQACTFLGNTVYGVVSICFLFS